MRNNIEDLFDKSAKKLNDNGLVVNKEKCIFGKTNINFLGHNVNAKGIQPSEEKITPTLKYPELTTIKEMQRFI